MKIKVLSIFLSFILIFCFTSFAFANNVNPYYHNGSFTSKLPEPVPTDNIKYVVFAETSPNYRTRLVCFEVPLPVSFSLNIQFDEDITDYWEYQIIIDTNTSSGSGSTNIPLNILEFDACSGQFVNINTAIVTNGYYGSFIPGIKGTEFDSYLCYGVTLINTGYDMNTVPIYWNYEETWNFQNIVENSLVYIQNYLASLEDLLSNIDANFDEFYSFQFPDYISEIYSYLGYLSNFIDWYEQTFYPFLILGLDLIEVDLRDCYDVLVDIRDLLGYEYESETISQPDGEDKIDELASAEAAIRSDIQGDMEAAFSDYGAVFNGNGAFALIQNGFNSIILSNSKFNALIIFCLTLGIAVLIIGRKMST